MTEKTIYLVTEKEGSVIRRLSFEEFSLAKTQINKMIERLNEAGCEFRRYDRHAHDSESQLFMDKWNSDHSIQVQPLQLVSK